MPLSIFFTILLSSYGAVSATYVSKADGQNLTACIAAKNVPIKLPTSPEFAQYAKPYNIPLVFTPAAIVLPTTQQHVSDAVVCASASGTKVQAKSGGHSYASFSLGGQNGSLVVELEPFNSVTVNKTNGVAKVGAGVRLGNLALEIFDQAQRSLPHGTCPGVGVGGHFTHGGYGYTSRLWGLSLDTIVGLDVVLANGTSRYTTNASYPDLFYALRGAADSFGVITTFYVQTLPAPNDTVNFYFEVPAALETAQRAAEAFLHIQDFAQNPAFIDRNIAFGVTVNVTPTFHALTIIGQYFGGAADFNARIKPELFRGLPSPAVERVNTFGWIDALSNIWGGPLPQPLTNYDLHDAFYAKSIVTKEKAPLTRAALESFFTYALNEGSKTAFPWFVIINLYGGPDSRINAVPPAASSYGDRSALWVFQLYGYSQPFSAAIAPFITGLTQSVVTAQPDGDFSAYVNYVDPALSAEEAHRQYYGEETFKELVRIKRDVDPLEVFWNPQAIRV
ncbi:MAG: hypothetical protein M1825_003369 [Sarcosagium campestre]|nr:MAG: hypothetical protein M1825_003369 [Sarcosagium campestre]